MKEEQLTETESPGTISGNDTEPEIPDTGDIPQEGDGTGQPPEESQPDQPPQDNGDTDLPSAEQPGSEAPSVNEPDTEWQEEVTAQLQLLQEAGDNGDITQRLDALLDLLTLEAEQDALAETEKAAVTPPFEGYQEWSYGIDIAFEVYPFGYGNYLSQNVYCGTPEEFEAWYQNIYNCIDDTIRDFYVKTITDDDGMEVYNYETDSEEPEPEEPPEEETTADLMLSHLENINKTLADMLAADMEYYQSAYDYQEQMLALQTRQTADTVILCVTLFILLGAMCAKAFIERFR